MFFIPVFLGSTRKGRQSIKPAKYILRRLRQQPQVETELADLAEYDFPIMEERLRFLKPEEVPPHLLAFSETIARADALAIVSPEYNNGYPGVLKNALDDLLLEYKRKPISAGRPYSIGYVRHPQYSARTCRRSPPSHPGRQAPPA